MVKDAAGKLQVETNKQFKAIDGVKDIVRKFGPNISPTSLRAVEANL